MIYKLALYSKEAADFKLEIEIAPTATFKELNDLIIKKLKYPSDQITSFFVCDDEWERLQEITLIEMDCSSDEDSYVMDSTYLEEFLQDEGDKMFFVYDNLSDKGFNIILREMKPGEIKKGKCVSMVGTAPKQVSIDIFAESSKGGSKLALDEEFYGSDEFNEDEFDEEGFSELDMSEIDI